MGVREVDRSLGQWEMNTKDVHRRMIVAQTPRDRERWHAVWLLAQGWTAVAVAEALERDPHTIGRWASAFGEGGPVALIFEQTGGSPRPRPDQQAELKNRCNCSRHHRAWNWATVIGGWCGGLYRSGSAST